MNNYSISDWRIFLNNGRRYMATARNGLGRPDVFTNDIVLQLTAMAMESLLVSVWQYHGRMPFDHTLSGLVDGLADFFPLDMQLVEGIKQVEGFDDICALMPSLRRAPTNSDISQLLDNGERLAAYVYDHLN